MHSDVGRQSWHISEFKEAGLSVSACRGLLKVGVWLAVTREVGRPLLQTGERSHTN